MERALDAVMEALRDPDTHIGKIRNVDGLTSAKSTQSLGRSFRGVSKGWKTN